VVQADSSAAETDYLLSIAQQHPSISAVVGWAELSSPDTEWILRPQQQIGFMA
jgi:L-fuconolactonase